MGYWEDMPRAIGLWRVWCISESLNLEVGHISADTVVMARPNFAFRPRSTPPPRPTLTHSSITLFRGLACSSTWIRCGREQNVAGACMSYSNLRKSPVCMFGGRRRPSHLLAHTATRAKLTRLQAVHNSQYSRLRSHTSSR
jgi:hypothetical protein